MKLLLILGLVGLAVAQARTSGDPCPQVGEFAFAPAKLLVCLPTATGNAWSSFTADGKLWITGSAGPQGPVGERGPVGPQGPPGPAGGVTPPVDPPVEPPPTTVRYQVMVYVYPAGKGTVKVSPALASVSPLGYAGSYRGMGSGPVTLTAAPAPGYRFARWNVGTSNPLSLYVARALTVQATFEVAR